MRSRNKGKSFWREFFLFYHIIILVWFSVFPVFMIYIFFIDSQIKITSRNITLRISIPKHLLHFTPYVSEQLFEYLAVMICHAAPVHGHCLPLRRWRPLCCGHSFGRSDSLVVLYHFAFQHIIKASKKYNPQSLLFVI